MNEPRREASEDSHWHSLRAFATPNPPSRR
jgi:hypothetical protein